MSNYQAALKYLLKDEGGYTDDPNDPGKQTNWGITIHDLSIYLGRPATVQEVKDMTQQTAGAIYALQYWNPLGLSGVQNDEVATCIFNQCVLRGIGFIKQIQSMVGTVPDGHVGPKTLAAINAYDANKLIVAIEQNGESFYNRLADSSRKLATFRRGWLNRCRRLLGLEK